MALERTVTQSLSRGRGPWEKPRFPQRLEIHPPAAFVLGMLSTQQWGQDVPHKYFQVLWQHTAPSVSSQKSHLEFQHTKPVKACRPGQNSCGSLSPGGSPLPVPVRCPQGTFWEPENLRAKPENCSLQEPGWVIFKIINYVKILTYFGANFVNSR